jgi:hypothetical protein
MENDTCPICSRPLGTERTEKHHLIPKTFGGRGTEQMHAICHRKIHATFSERELKNYYNTAERILEHEDMKIFVAWVANKSLDFYIVSRDSSSRKSKRRR